MFQLLGGVIVLVIGLIDGEPLLRKNELET
jgi:hypothetical protein